MILFGVSDSTCLHRCVSFTVWIKHLWWRYGTSHKQEKHPSETSEGVKSCLECLESLRFAFYVHSTFILRILTSPDSAMSRPHWEPRRGQRRCGHWHGREQPPARCPWLQVTLRLTESLVQQTYRFLSRQKILLAAPCNPVTNHSEVILAWVTILFVVYWAACERPYLHL